MAQLIHADAAGHIRTLTIEGRILIGRNPNCDLVLTGKGIAKNHAEVLKKNDACYLTDLNTSGGTFLNEKRITHTLLHDGDEIGIGKNRISFKQKEEKIRAASDTSDRSITGSGKLPPEPSDIYLSPENEKRLFDLKVKIHQMLLQRIDLKRLKEAELKEVTEKTIRNIVVELGGDIPEYISQSMLIRELINDSLGLGPLEDLMADEDITEIMVNHKNQIYIEKLGKLFLTEKKFLSDEQIISVIQRIVAPLGRGISESKPMVDARLPDGSRVNAIIPPIAINGPTLTIRRFPKIQMRMDDWVRFGSLDARIADFLELCVSHKKNIIVTGGTSSGKTTLLNILAAFIPSNERIITVEDAAELQLQQEHLVSLEARPANIEGKGEITFRDLVINCLRMRPDRIIVGECRGGEAVDMLQAMNTGHEGSMTTIHANNPRDSLSRIETMVLMSGMDLPSRAIREQIALAIDVIVQTQRYSDGTRKIAQVVEVTGMEKDIILTQDIYYFRQRGITETDKVFGEFLPTTIVPKFISDLSEKGIPIPTGMFRS